MVLYHLGYFNFDLKSQNSQWISLIDKGDKATNNTEMASPDTVYVSMTVYISIDSGENFNNKGVNNSWTSNQSTEKSKVKVDDKGRNPTGHNNVYKTYAVL
jgi:hypothetical protein